MKRDLPGWAFNQGEGFKTQKECTELADALDAYLKQFPKEEISLESDLRVDDEGRFLPEGSKGGKSPYVTDREHVMEFVTFLRSCGGFKIL